MVDRSFRSVLQRAEVAFGEDEPREETSPPLIEGEDPRDGRVDPASGGRTVLVVHHPGDRRRVGGAPRAISGIHRREPALALGLRAGEACVRGAFVDGALHARWSCDARAGS